MNQLVTIHNGEPRTTSVAIAEGTQTEHASVIKLARSYRDDLEEFGPCRFEIDVVKRVQGGGTKREYALLNEPQATLIMTYMKNTPVVREFKKRLVKAFYEMSGNNAIIIQRLMALETRLNLLTTSRPLARDPKNPNFLFQRFREVSGGMSVARWYGTTNIPYSLETVNSVLYRNATTTAPTLSCIMRALGYSEQEINEHIQGLGHSPGRGGRILKTPLLIEQKRKRGRPKQAQKGGDTMEIDVSATNKKFDERCINRSAWARSKGINPAVFYQRLHGHLKMPEHIINLLKSDNLLVTKKTER